MGCVTHLETVGFVLVLGDVGTDEGDGVGKIGRVGVEVIVGCG